MKRLGLAVLLSVVILFLRVQAAETEQQVKQADCPKAVQKTLNRESRGGEIKEIEKGKQRGRLVFEAEVWINGKEYEVQIAAAGTLLSKILEGENSDEQDGDEDEENEIETQIKPSDLPKPVRRTLRRESRGGEIDELEKVQQGRSTTYEAEIEIGDTDYEIEIAENGTLLSKVVDE